jgi:hypothetical protein
MAEQNPTSGGRAVPIDLPADHIAILQSDLGDWLAGVRKDLKKPERMSDPERARREADAFERLLAGLDRGEILIPDEDARSAVESAARGHDRANNYIEIASAHDAHHGLLACLEGRAMSRSSGRRLRFPEAVPPGLNYSILTGTLIDGPRLARSPVDEPIILLEIEFPVADPERPQLVWTWASCQIEVPDTLAQRQGIRKLQHGDSLLVSGQHSNRWKTETGFVGKRDAIVASLIHSGPPPDLEEFVVAGQRFRP